MSTPASLAHGFAHLSGLEKINLGGLAVGVAALSAHLWLEWSKNPDLSHDLLMPVFFLLLLHESRRNGTIRHLRVGPVASGTVVLLAAGGLLALVARVCMPSRWIGRTRLSACP
ncbi:MAG: hypothetical protein EXS38_03855 [Opitutus sp.]|nr:hypothetical protein [Opitutus sp.]